MNSKDVTEVCRLCPATGQVLLNVFDERLSVKNNMKDVIFVTTGIEILELDLISTKICERCCNITLKMFQFREDALKQDRALRERCNQYLADRGICIPNTSIKIKQEKGDSSKKDKIHPSIRQLYQTCPNLKLPKTCLNRHMAPIVSLPMGQVEKYFKRRNLDMKQYIYNPAVEKAKGSNIVKKRTTIPPQDKRTVTPLKIRKKVLDDLKTELSVCVNPTVQKKARKTSNSSSEGSKSSKKLRIEEFDKIKTTQAASNADFSEDSRDSSTSNLSSNVGKPDFLETFGLTPAVTATKSHTMLVCNICDSVHNNAFELKRHTSKHMVCQFCKLRFKSLDSKRAHIDNSCEVKQIMNSPGPTVDLERIHLNADIRRKYPDAFFSCESISEPSPVPVQGLTNHSNVIVLSDDEDNSSPTVTNGPYPTVSIVKPEVRINYSTVLSEVATNAGDKQLLKDLLRVTNKRNPVERMLQTDVPSNKDIKLIGTEGMCEFDKLKEQLLTYKVPVNIKNGPFQVSYKFKTKITPSAKSFDMWHTLHLVEKASTSNESLVEAVATSAQNTHLVSSSQNSASSKPSAKAVVTSTQNRPLVSSFQSSASSKPPVKAVITSAQNRPLVNSTQSSVSSKPNAVPGTPPPITPVNPVASNSPTPLLQNYLLTLPPPVPIAITSQDISRSNNAFNTYKLKNSSINTVTPNVAKTSVSTTSRTLSPSTTLTSSITGVFWNSVLNVSNPSTSKTSESALTTVSKTNSLSTTTLTLTSLLNSAPTCSQPTISSGTTTTMFGSVVSASTVSNSEPKSSASVNVLCTISSNSSAPGNLSTATTNTLAPSNPASNLPVLIGFIGIPTTNSSSSSLPIANPPNVIPATTLSNCNTAICDLTLDEDSAVQTVSSNSNNVSASEATKFRVKNVWELR